MVISKVINGEYPSRVRPKENSNDNILYSDNMWNNILVRTWEYDPYSRLPLTSISTLLGKMKSQNSQTPRIQTSGMQTPRSQTPGMQTPRSQTPGTQTPGTQTPRSLTPDPKTNVRNKKLINFNIYIFNSI